MFCFIDLILTLHWPISLGTKQVYVETFLSMDAVLEDLTVHLLIVLQSWSITEPIITTIGVESKGQNLNIFRLVFMI